MERKEEEQEKQRAGCRRRTRAFDWHCCMRAIHSLVFTQTKFFATMHIARQMRKGIQLLKKGTDLTESSRIKGQRKESVERRHRQRVGKWPMKCLP